MPKLNSLSGK